jgi:hypothetical protein
MTVHSNRIPDSLSLQDWISVPDIDPRIVFDTSALLDLFGKWTDDHKQRRGDLVKEVHILAPLRRFLFSTQAIRREVHDHMIIGTDLERYLAFEEVLSEFRRMGHRVRMDRRRVDWAASDSLKRRPALEWFRSVEPAQRDDSHSGDVRSS